jgi:hypothetical protein
MTMSKIKINSIVLVGRRWFNRTKGHTYHSVEIIVDGKHVSRIPYCQGYGEQYEWNAFAWLEANGYLPGREHNEPPFSYCQRHCINYTKTVTEVQRKQDL